MKKLLLIVAIIAGVGASSLKAQEEASSPFSVGADLYSNYVWRGTKFGSGPAFQPGLSFTKGILTVGVWGSFDAAGYAEADPYVSLGIGDLSVGLTNYYYPGTEMFDYSDSTGNNAFELNLGYSIGSLSLSGNYIFNEAGGAASVGGDMYFEASYDFENASVFVGAGDGWHTSDTEFALCNIGISTSKTIELSDKFSLPVSGSVILNPDKEQLYVVVGVSF